MAKKSKEARAELENDATQEGADAKEETAVAELQDNSEVKKQEGETDADKKIKELQEQIRVSDELRKKSDEAKREAEERFEREKKERLEAVEKARTADNKSLSAQRDAINQAIEAAKSALESSKKEYKMALEAGDSEKVVEFQEKLAEATYLNARLKENKANFDLWEKKQEEISKAPKNTLTPETQSWIDKNPRFVTDQAFKATATAAHYDAIAKGIRPDTSDYFQFIDKKIQRFYGEDEKTETPPKKEKQEKESSYSAPPSRGGGSEESSSGKKVYKLTAEQMEAAEFMKMTPVEYAQLLEAEKGRK